MSRGGGRVGGCAMLAAVRVGASRTRGLCTGGTAGKRQQRDIARALDGHTEPALMARANAGHPARKNLAALLDELRKNVGALVVDHVHLLNAELADLLFTEVLPLAARTAAGAARTTRAAFAPRTAGTALAPRSTVTARTTMTTRTTTRTMAASFPVRCTGRSLRLRWFLFVCHNLVPFSSGAAEAALCNSFQISNGLEACPAQPVQKDGSRVPPLHRRLRLPKHQLAAACSAGCGWVVRRGRRAARASRLPPSFFCRFRSSSRRMVRYLMTTSCTRRRRSSSAINSP